MGEHVGRNALLLACSMAGMSEKEISIVVTEAGLGPPDKTDVKTAARRARVWTNALFERSITPGEFEEEMWNAVDGNSKQLKRSGRE